MKITQLKQQTKNPQRVSVFLEGKYSFSLTLDQLLAEKLKKGVELNEQDVVRLKKMSDEGKLRGKALEWLMGRPHSIREFRDYLYRKKAGKEFIEALVEEFSDRNYLNDESFARWFAELRIRKNKSLRAIRSELSSKGIEPAIVQTVVADLESGDLEALKILVNKLSNRPRYRDEQKLKAYLLSKGFSYSDIKEVLSIY